MQNFNEIFMSVFPKEGYFVQNHHDFHRLNFIVHKETQKMYVIDHEYASLGLIGHDIANFFTESNFNYTPNYYFLPEEINFDFFFEFYKKYTSKFELNFKNILEKEEESKLFELIKSKKYYITLHCIINLFWLLYSAIYLNFNDEFGKEQEVGAFTYFQHGIDRLIYFERAFEALKNCSE